MPHRVYFMQLFQCCAAIDKEKALKELEQTFKNAG